MKIFDRGNALYLVRTFAYFSCFICIWVLFLSSCLSSRARKIRCDSTRPSCNNCVRRQNECQYDAVPKRRGPDKRPGTRQRSCKKRPADGSMPPVKKKQRKGPASAQHQQQHQGSAASASSATAGPTSAGPTGDVHSPGSGAGLRSPAGGFKSEEGEDVFSHHLNTRLSPGVGGMHLTSETRLEMHPLEPPRGHHPHSRARSRRS